MKAGDVIVAVDGEKIETPRELSRKIAAAGPGKTVELTYLRGGAEKTARVKLGALPAEKELRADLGGVDKSSALAGLGLEVQPAAQARRGGGEGLYITNIDPDGVAAQKGLRRGDVILEVGGQAVNDRADLAAALEAARKEGHSIRAAAGEVVGRNALRRAASRGFVTPGNARSRTAALAMRTAVFSPSIAATTKVPRRPRALVGRLALACSVGLASARERSCPPARRRTTRFL